MFISLKSLKACMAHTSHWLIVCHEIRNEEGVNVPCLSVLGLLVFVRWLTHLDGGSTTLVMQGAKRRKGNAIYGKAEAASRGGGNLLVFTTVKHQLTTSHIREQCVLQAESSWLIAAAPAPVNNKIKNPAAPAPVNQKIQNPAAPNHQSNATVDI